jgi:hypothetical protein
MAISGKSPLFAPPSIPRGRFVNRLLQAKSPAADEAESIYRRMVNNGFDPLIALGQFQAESGLGTSGFARHTRNWGNILFYPWTAELGALDFAADNGFHYSRFPSWTDGVRAYIRLMKSYERKGLDTVETMAARWLGDKPGTERTERYVSNIVQASARLGAPPKHEVQAPAHAAPATPPPPPVVYVVKAGDTLSAIAKHQLGLASRWPEIYRIPANRATIGRDPGLIRADQRLIMPKR